MTTRLRPWRLACVLVAGAILPWTGGPGVAGTPWGADYFPDVAVTTQDGKTLRFYEDLLKGRSVAINLYYTSCPDVCPLVTANLVQVQALMGDRMGRDVWFYSIAIDPWDTPKENKAYAQKFGVGPGWLFLSGKEADIQLIVRKLGLSRAGDATSKDGHSPSLMVGNVPKGMWMRNSAMDNPQFLSTTMANFLGWKSAAANPSYTEARPLAMAKGEFLFQSRCQACHTVGEGDRIGPDLKGVTQRREPRWLASYLAEPERMLAAGDPIATSLFRKYQQVRMPNLALGSEDVAALLSFIDTRSREK